MKIARARATFEQRGLPVAATIDSDPRSAWAVDPQFGNTLDGFVMIDLTRTSPEILGRYMGKQQARRFLAWRSTTQPRVA